VYSTAQFFSHPKMQYMMAHKSRRAYLAIIFFLKMSFSRMVAFVGNDLCDKGDTTSLPATYFETFMPVSY